MQQKYVSYEDIARHWGVKVITVRGWVCSQRLGITATRFGHRVRFETREYERECMRVFGKLPEEPPTPAPQPPDVDIPRIREQLHEMINTCAELTRQANEMLRTIDNPRTEGEGQRGCRVGS